MSDRPCRKDDPNWDWPCSCDDCARQAAATWTGYMAEVLDGDITLEEAITLDENGMP